MLSIHEDKDEDSVLAESASGIRIRADGNSVILGQKRAALGTVQISLVDKIRYKWWDLTDWLKPLGFLVFTVIYIYVAYFIVIYASIYSGLGILGGGLALAGITAWMFVRIYLNHRSLMLSYLASQSTGRIPTEQEIKEAMRAQKLEDDLYARKQERRV